MPRPRTPRRLCTNAALIGHQDVAELLLVNKAEINAKSKRGETPWHDALAEGHTDVMKLLRQYGGVE